MYSLVFPNDQVGNSVPPKTKKNQKGSIVVSSSKQSVTSTSRTITTTGRGTGSNSGRDVNHRSERDVNHGGSRGGWRS